MTGGGKFTVISHAFPVSAPQTFMFSNVGPAKQKKSFLPLRAFFLSRCISIVLYLTQLYLRNLFVHGMQWGSWLVQANTYKFCSRDAQALLNGW